MLDRRYIVVSDYEPSANDELKLRQGDTVVLDLLFSDGWAKGKNENSAMEGILPVACIKVLE